MLFVFSAVVFPGVQIAVTGNFPSSYTCRMNSCKSAAAFNSSLRRSIVLRAIHSPPAVAAFALRLAGAFFFAAQYAFIRAACSLRCFAVNFRVPFLLTGGTRADLGLTQSGTDG